VQDDIASLVPCKLSSGAIRLAGPLGQPAGWVVALGVRGGGCEDGLACVAGTGSPDGALAGRDSAPGAVVASAGPDVVVADGSGAGRVVASLGSDALSLDARVVRASSAKANTG
jgi:hypothetical protein